MKLHLLLISSNGFPPRLLNLLERANFTLEQVRGRLRIKELSAHMSFDAAVWLYGEEDADLALELAESIEQQLTCPLVLVTKELESPPNLKNLPRLATRLDLNDEPAEFLRAVQGACSQSRIAPSLPKHSVPEIDFKNAMSQVMEGKKPLPDTDEPTLRLGTSWVAVDEVEKRILAGPVAKKQNNLLSLFSKLIKKS